MGKRVQLEPSTRAHLFNLLRKKHGSLKAISLKLDIPYSTLKKYTYGDFFLPDYLFEKILSLGDIDRSNVAFSYLEDYWGQRMGGRKAMQTLERKYPDQLREWRRLAHLHSTASNKKKIVIPPLNEKLAEFLGIYLGDGTLTPYFIRISSDYRYDLPYFDYVKKLIFDLFGLDVRIRKEKKSNAVHLTIFSKELCSLLHNEYNMAYGHKIRNNTLIPESILKNPSLSLACLRGLMDTDGSISRRGRNGEQFTACFSSYNPNLIKQIKEISEPFGIFTYISKYEDEIGTNSANKIRIYFDLVGSSNLRHIVRFYERFFKNNTLYQKEVSNYYQKPFYSDLKLPFKLAL